MDGLNLKPALLSVSSLSMEHCAENTKAFLSVTAGEEPLFHSLLIKSTMIKSVSVQRALISAGLTKLLHMRSYAVKLS